MLATHFSNNLKQFDGLYMRVVHVSIYHNLCFPYSHPILAPLAFPAVVKIKIKTCRIEFGVAGKLISSWRIL